MRILRRGSSTTGGLAAESRATPPAVTQLIDRLVRKGLVERRAAEADRRAVVIALSGEGARLVDEFRRRRGEILAGTLERMSGVEQHQVLGALERMLELLENIDARHGTAPLKVILKSVR